MNSKVWELAKKGKVEDIIDTLLEIRGIKSEKDKKEFIKPIDPRKIKAEEVGISASEIKKATKRIKQAIKNKEKIIIFGDYDADGVCATAIMWEALYKIYKKVLPYIPERFSEGYGLNAESVKKLKEEDPSLGLIITVDNGIVANDAVDAINKMEVDIIITDHHEIGKKKPKAFATIHTTQIGGAAVSWFFARKLADTNSLELAAIGTIADQIPLTGANRSIVKFGLEELNKTKRVGLKSVIKDSSLELGTIGTYEIGFVIAPRINAMGRLEHAIESLRLLCTRDSARALELSKKMGRVNQSRQKIVEEVLTHTRLNAEKLSKNNVIVISHESYHEGVIGLAAGRLVEEFYRPSIVISKGEKISKASARSISGFNIIEAIRMVDHLIVQGGGHPMAAGFSIETKKIDKFSKELNKVSANLLNDDILQRKLKADMEISFDQINWDLVEKLSLFEPTGIGNFIPTFVTKGIEVVDVKTVGREAKHLKLKLKEGKSFFSSIAFNFGSIISKITPGTTISAAYVVEINTWNSVREIQLRIRDMKLED